MTATYLAARSLDTGLIDIPAPSTRMPAGRFGLWVVRPPEQGSSRRPNGHARKAQGVARASWPVGRVLIWGLRMLVGQTQAAEG
jgi:hypothetical protein